MSGDGGDKRLLPASEDGRQPIIPVMEFNFRLDEALSYPARQEPAGCCCGAFQSAPTSKLTTVPVSSVFSRLAPELRTSINSPAQFHVAGCSASAARGSVRPILCCFCASASRLRGGVGLLGGCWLFFLW